MNEKVQDFRELIALLIGNNVERPGKHLQRTEPFHWGSPFHIGCRGLGRIQPLEPKSKCEGKALEVTTTLWKEEQEPWGFGTVSETRRTQH